MLELKFAIYHRAAESSQASPCMQYGLKNHWLRSLQAPSQYGLTKPHSFPCLYAHRW